VEEVEEATAEAVAAVHHLRPIPEMPIPRPMAVEMEEAGAEVHRGGLETVLMVM
jgi:hypothetical protein